jgi:hypothetical protein
VKEKRKGPIGRAAGLAEGVAATVRRLQREREPRLLVYDETGYARLVQPDGRGYERLLDTAEQMVALVSQAEAEAKPRMVRRTEKAEEAIREGEDADEPKKPRGSRAERAGQAKKPRAGRTERADDAKKPRASRTARAGEAKKPRTARTARAGGAKKPRATRERPGAAKKPPKDSS